MPQQQIPYNEGGQRGSESTYKGYEEAPPIDYVPSAPWEMGAQKISVPSMGHGITAGSAFNVGDCFDLRLDYRAFRVDWCRNRDTSPKLGCDSSYIYDDIAYGLPEHYQLCI